jgi:hypothetical protein
MTPPEWPATGWISTAAKTSAAGATHDGQAVGFDMRASGQGRAATIQRSRDDGRRSPAYDRHARDVVHRTGPEWVLPARTARPGARCRLPLHRTSGPTQPENGAHQRYGSCGAFLGRCAMRDVAEPPVPGPTPPDPDPGPPIPEPPDPDPIQVPIPPDPDPRRPTAGRAGRPR